MIPSVTTAEGRRARNTHAAIEQVSYIGVDDRHTRIVGHVVCEHAFHQELRLLQQLGDLSAQAQLELLFHDLLQQTVIVVMSTAESAGVPGSLQVPSSSAVVAWIGVLVIVVLGVVLGLRGRRYPQHDFQHHYHHDPNPRHDSG